MLKENKGVTLVALVITIIVLLILAGVTLAMVLGDSGIFSKANTASVETNLSNAKDAVRLALLEVVTNNYNDDGTQKNTLSSSGIETEINKQLTSVGDGYSLSSGIVSKDSNPVKDASGQQLKANFTDNNGTVTVSFSMEPVSP